MRAAFIDLGLKDLIDSFPEEMVNSNFFFLANKCETEEDSKPMTRSEGLPQVQYERFRRVGITTPSPCIKLTAGQSETELI